MKKIGFTLAEVLITLGIIGVVAALTIPTLVKNFQKKSYVSGLQKAISLTTQTFKLILATEGVDYLSQTSVFNSINDNRDWNAMIGDQSEFVAALGKYMKISKACINPNYDTPDSNCDVILYKDLSNKDITDNNTIFSKFGRVKLYLSDGMTYYLRLNKHTNEYINSAIGEIEVDVNGDKGPNILGRDCFSFLLLDNAQILLPGSKYWQNDIGGNYWSDDRVIDLCGIDYSPGDYCAARVFESGWKMDY